MCEGPGKTNMIISAGSALQDQALLKNEEH